MILPLTPVRLKRHASRIFGPKVGVVCEDLRFTYREFDERSDRLSDALLRMGLRKGEVVAFLSFNCHRLLEAYFGVPQLGAILLPLNIRLGAEELTYILNDAGKAKVNQSGGPLRGELKGDYDPNFIHAFNLNFVYRF